MLYESLFHILFLLSTLLCSLVAGFILVFAIVVMPGIGTLKHRDFLRAFQAMDRIIQNNHPLFVFIWVGSAVVLLATTVMGIGQLEGIERLLLIIAALSYLVGTQWPTIAINIPLNNRLQALKIDALDETTLNVERTRFEARWNRWNAVRTTFAVLTAVLLSANLLMQ